MVSPQTPYDVYQFRFIVHLVPYLDDIWDGPLFWNICDRYNSLTVNLLGIFWTFIWLFGRFFVSLGIIKIYKI